MDKKKRTLLKSAVLGITAIATSLTFGMSAACSTSGGGNSSSDNDDDKTTTKIDEQTIKNGNFEFYSDNKGLYPISNPDNWTKGSNGSTSSSMSGVINTSKERWDYFASDELAKELEANDDLESTDENKKDYNGALADDLPYKNTHTATDTSSSTEDDAHAKDFIDNPYTHKYRFDDDGNVFDVDGKQVTTYKDKDGKLFLDADCKVPLETSVLMIHNYRSGDYYGAETHYTSSTTVSLEANTAAEISLWVKTTEMYFGGSSKEDERDEARIEFDRGAYIKVNTNVGGNSLDAFEIKNINTEQLIKDNEDIASSAENGWIQYTVYVAASTFATTTVNLTVGLGENESGTVEGYAFFDDVTIKKYVNKDDMTDTDETKNPQFANIREIENDENPNVSYPLSPDAQNEFRVDVQKVKTNKPDYSGVTDKIYENNSADRYFFIDFANSAFKSSNTIELNTENVKAGLTVEETNTGKYVCTKFDNTDNRYQTNLDSKDYSGLYIPNSLKNNGINTIKHDVLATTTVGSGEDWKFNPSFDTEYSDIITDALKTAPLLPGAGANPDALVMLSAYGAAYEAHIRDNSFKLADDEFMLVSFWIKTSDMNGKTAATVTVKGLEGDDKDIKSSFTVDTTTLSKVTIGEGDDKIEDAYKGWVRCFIRVSNTSDDKDNKKPFEIVVNFGTTNISTSTKSSYKAGWVALTNLSVMELDEDVYGYTSGSAQTATIEFTETAEKTSHKFDTELGEKNEIKTDLATPASYTGVNGNSKFINRDTVIDLDGYQDTNKNDYAGILSKDNFANYASRDCMWYNALKLIETDNTTSDKLWNAVFGERTVQPLLIVNTVRTFRNTETKQDESKIYNYGYIGKSSSVSANGYSAVSVRVKASAGAIANIYLVEDKTGGNVLTYTTPEYNFWYDADGNILKHEPAEKEKPEQQKENLAYTLRTDGLYENDDGKLYANFYNLTRQYDISFEHESYYNESGESVKFEDLVKGEVYYTSAAKTAYAPHYLIAGGKDNNKVYLYSGEGTGDSATYFYIEDGKANTKKVVFGVDKSIARYVNTEAPDTPYYFEIDTTSAEGEKYADKWITVTFYIHAGAEAKNYKLELWSGKREEDSSYTGTTPSYVIFDYSDLGSSLNQSTFDGLVKGYTDDIIAEYKKNIDELDDNDLNIADLEEKAGEGNRVGLYDYEASYYTFSLYDSEAFIPFNGEINTDETGYSFDYTESEESLTFLKVVDNGLPYGVDDKNNPDAIYTMSAFIDYSVIDKDVDIIGEPTAPGTSDSGSSNTSSGDSGNVWLLASSIVLVAAMLLAIAALFIRDFVKKHKGRKSSSKNSYNFNKNKRYVKKYVKANGEAPVIEEGEVDESLLSDKPAEVEGSATAADTEAPAEETTAEETPVESTEETPSEEEKPEDGNKDE